MDHHAFFLNNSTEMVHILFPGQIYYLIHQGHTMQCYECRILRI